VNPANPSAVTTPCETSSQHVVEPRREQACGVRSGRAAHRPMRFERLRHLPRLTAQSFPGRIRPGGTCSHSTSLAGKSETRAREAGDGRLRSQSLGNNRPQPTFR
jgi:hypothetical protein